MISRNPEDQNRPNARQSRLKPLRYVTACAALLLLLIGFACNLNTENGHTYINVKKDTAWVHFDSLEITWKDPSSGAEGLLFHGDPATLLDVNRLEAQGYQGGKITVTVKGFLNHIPVYEDHRGFDGANPAATTKDIVLGGPAKTDSPIVVVTVRPTPPRLSPILSEPTVSIHDSVSFLANAVLDSGSLKAYAFDYNGDGRYDDSVPITGLSARIQGRFRYDADATYKVSLKVIAQTDSVAIAQVSVLVLKDEPIADAGQDTTVYPSTLIHLHGRGTDGLGRIVKTEWKVANGPFLPAPQDTTFTAPTILGDIQAFYRVTDDDTLSAIDSVLVHVISTTESNLTGIVVSKGTLAPQFNPTVFTYTDTVPFDATSLTVTPTGNGVLTVNGAVVVSGTPSGPVTVGPGTTTMEVTVELAGSPKKTYSVTVVRPTPAANNRLKSLHIRAGALDTTFAPTDSGYAFTVGNSQDSATVSVQLEDTNATVTLGGIRPDASLARKIPLTVGSNPLPIVVTAQNGAIKTYALTVTRATPLSANADLAGLAISAGSLDTAFRATDTLYKVALPNATVNFSISVALADTGARYTVMPASPMTLKVGANPISVAVTAKNGSRKTYSVTVTRAASSNADLSNLFISAGSFDTTFNAADTLYKVSVAYSVTYTPVTAYVADTTASVSITPLSPVTLKVGTTVVSAVVTAQDGTKKTYAIAITRDGSANANLATLTVSPGALDTAFKPADTLYTVVVANNIATSTITATVADTSARLTIAPSQPMTLSVGANPVSIVVTAQNGLKKTYAIVINKSLKAIAVAAGYQSLGVILEDGKVITWGNSNLNPKQPAGLTGVKALATGMHAVAVKGDGTVVAWGDNAFGEATVPAGLTGVTAVATGFYFSEALKADSTVVVWGAGTEGEKDIPPGLTGVKAISAGAYFLLALKADGTVVGWGNNPFGETIIPTGLTGVKAIAAGNFHAMALKNDGTVVAWGNNEAGQATVPAGLTGVKAISAGGDFCAALKTDGTIVAWGSNSDGQTDIPTGLSGIQTIAAGSTHIMALKADGTVTAWGTYSETLVPPEIK